MSSKKPNSLRDALREMRVNQANRLPKSGPSFRPPSENGKEVPHFEAPPSQSSQNEITQNGVARNELPQIKASPMGQPPIEVPQNKTAQNERAHNEQTRIELAQEDIAQSEDARNESPQFDKPHKEPTQSEATQSEVAREKVPNFEAASSKSPRTKAAQKGAPSEIKLAQSEPPQIEQPSRAFFRLSDRAFSYPQLQQLSGDCFRLFLWMSSRGWRYQNSDGMLRASVGFIENNTGMSHATISRCLKTLRENGLLELREIDYKRGNLWRISPVAFAGCGPEDLPPRSEEPQNGGPRKGAPAPSKRDRSSLKLSEKAPQNEQQNRNIYKHKNLSQEDAKPFLDRIEKIRAPEKQRMECEGLAQLLETYTVQEMTVALGYIDSHGTLAGEACHSPFRYLTKAMDDVLRVSGGGGAKPSTQIVNSVTSNVAVAVGDEGQNTDLIQSALATFESNLTEEERGKVITDYVAKEFSWGYSPSPKLASRLAALRWFESRNVTQHAVAQ